MYNQILKNKIPKIVWKFVGKSFKTPPSRSISSLSSVIVQVREVYKRLGSKRFEPRSTNGLFSVIVRESSPSKTVV